MEFSMLKKMRVILLGFCLSLNAFAAEVSGSLEVNYDHLICTNQNLVAKDESLLSLSPGYNASLNYLMLVSGNKASMLLTLNTAFDTEKLFSELLEKDYFEYFGVSENYRTPVIWQIDSFIDGLSININYDAFTVMIGDAQGKAGALVLPSKGIRGIYVENTFNLTKRLLGRDDYASILDMLHSPYSAKKVDFGKYYFENIYQVKNEIYFNVFGGESAQRSLAISEGDEEVTNELGEVLSGFQSTNRLHDLNGNEIKDASRSTSYREYLAGGMVQFSLGAFDFGVGSVFVQEDPSSLNYSNSAEAFVGVSETPFRKLVSGANFGVAVVPEIFGFVINWGMLWKDEDITTNHESATNFKFSYKGDFDLTLPVGYNAYLGVVYADDGYEDASGESAADADVFGVNFYNQIDRSDKWGTFAVNIDFSRDNVVPSNFFSASGFTKMDYQLGLESEVSFWESTLSAANYVYYSHSLRDGTNVLGTNDDGTTNTEYNAQINNIKENIKIKWKKDFEVLAITPSVGYTFYNDFAGILTNTNNEEYNKLYHKVDASLGLTSSLLESLLLISFDFSFSYKVDQDSISVWSLSPDLDIVAKLFKRKVNLKTGGGYTYDFNGDSSTFAGGFEHLHSYSAYLGLEWYITSQLMVGVNYTFAGKTYVFEHETTDAATLEETAAASGFVGHIIGGQVTWLY